MRPGARLRSRIEGVGVFAVRHIPKNTRLFHYAPESYELVRLDDIVDKNIQQLYSDLFVQEEGYVWVPRSGMRSVDMSYYLNHSKHPNVQYMEDKNWFVSLKSIEQGEELTYDYNCLSEKQKWNYTSTT